MTSPKGSETDKLVVAPVGSLTVTAFAGAVEYAAKLLLEDGFAGDVIVIVGVCGDGSVAFCADGCCVDEPGVIVVAPDTLEVEAEANNEVLPKTAKMVVPGGRFVLVYRGRNDWPRDE